MAKKPGMTIAIGVGKPSGPPRPPKGLQGAPQIADEPDQDDSGEEDEGQKASAEDALVIRGGKACGDCANYQEQSGECAKVEGVFAPDDSCLRYFEAKGADMGEQEPDQDDMGQPQQ